MSRTPGNNDDDLAVPVVPEASAQAFTLPDEALEEIPDGALPPAVAEAAAASPRADAEVFAREAAAAVATGEPRRAAALGAAQALLVERRAAETTAAGAPSSEAPADSSTDGAAEAAWRSAFDADPTLLVAFWGLRRTLVRRRAWKEVAEVIERRITALAREGPRPGLGRIRADLWWERGRLAEDRLEDDETAARSYRAALTEDAEHAGVVLSLLLHGWRCRTPAVTAEALGHLLRRPLAPALRAVAAAALARIERTAPEAGAGGSEPAVAEPAASRAFESLRATMKEIAEKHGGEGARLDLHPLLDELAALTRVTREPKLRAEMLGELAAALETADPPLAAALFREQARLYGHRLRDRAAAELALGRALSRAPGHPLVIADLADLAESEAAGAPASESLAAILTEVAPQDRPLESAAEQELALRLLAALAREGKAAAGLELLRRHPELGRERLDVVAVELALAGGADDLAGLEAAFEGRADKIAASDPAEAAHALVVAGVLRERRGDPELAVAQAESLFRRALEIDAGYRPAIDALERLLGQAGRWEDLAAIWTAEHAASAPAPGAGADASFRRVRLLDRLVAVYRDDLDDPARALAFQEELCAERPDDVRSWVRRRDLELDLAARGEPVPAAAEVRTLRELAARAGVPAVSAPLLAEAGRIAAAAGERETAGALFREALANDAGAVAASGLERLAADPAGRAEVVRVELDAAVKGAVAAERLRALRFRLAWHSLAAKQPREAVEALAPLRAEGDVLAHAWSWEIARRAGDSVLELDVLAGAPGGPVAARLEIATDVGEALERAGKLDQAAAAFREVLRVAPSTDAALGLLRVGAALGSSPAVLEATRSLAALAEPSTRPPLAREAALLSLAHGEAVPAAAEEPPPVTKGGTSVGIAAAEVHPDVVLLGFLTGIRGGAPDKAAEGLLALGRALADSGGGETAVADRDALYARAAARARLGGLTTSVAMHERVQAASGGTAPIDVGLTDLPVAGEPARAAARAARAQRNGGAMAVTLDIEAALDAEARGQGAVALQAFLRALGRDPSDIEALEGVRRLATAGGDRLGAARAALRLGAVLRVPARAAAAFLEAAEALEALGQIGDAVIACWRALERLPDSEVIYQRLHGLLMEAGDPAGLDRLYGRRLAAVAEPDAQVAVLLERAEHRRERLQDRKAAVEDFKRILKIDPGHPAALRRLATLAEQMEYFPQAARFLERLLAVETDGDRAALLRLELAGVWDAAREPVRARDVLRKAAAARPLDSAPWQRLTDLALRLGDWSGALDALRSWERLASDPQVRAGLWVRIGGLLRDHARDAAKAAAAFANAATLDPLGEGVHALVELHERNGATAARRQVLDNAIADLQVELGTDPVDVPRLERLRELIALAGAGRDDAQAGLFREADAAVGQVLALLGEAPAAGPPPGRRRTFASPPSPDFWGRIWPPDAGGLAAQIWPLLASAAAELHPQSQLARPRAAIRVPPGTDRRFSWIEAAATALGLPTLSLYFLESSTDVAPIVIDTGEPTLVVGLATLAGDATARFWVGRALALLRERAVLLEPLPATEVGALLAAAAAVAGVSPPVAAGALRAVEERARALARAMGRKERKALALQASRFTSERIDAAAFREAMLAGADRLGLVMAGDVAAAVRAVAGPAAAAARTARSAVAGDARALALVRFALTDDYLLLRNAGDGGDGGGWG